MPTQLTWYRCIYHSLSYTFVSNLHVQQFCCVICKMSMYMVCVTQTWHGVAHVWCKRLCWDCCCLPAWWRRGCHGRAATCWHDVEEGNRSQQSVAETTGEGKEEEWKGCTLIHNAVDVLHSVDALLMWWRRGKRGQHRAAKITSKSKTAEGNAVSPSWCCWHVALCWHDKEAENRTWQARVWRRRERPKPHLHDVGGAPHSVDMKKMRTGHNRQCRKEEEKDRIRNFILPSAYWHDEEEENRTQRARARKKRRTRSSPSLCRWHAAVCWHCSWTPQQLWPSPVDDTWLSPCRKHHLPKSWGLENPANESDTDPHFSDSACPDYPEHSNTVITYVVPRRMMWSTEASFAHE